MSRKMSNEQSVLELHKINKAVLEKTAFMLITASTASIGYILTQIKGETWSNIMFLPLISLVLISSSFCFGASYLGTYAKFTNINAQYLQPINPHLKLELFHQINYCVDMMNFKNILQFYTFILGAFFYAIYVFIGMFKF